MNVKQYATLIAAAAVLAACSSRDGGGNGEDTDPNPSDFPSVGVPDQDSMSLSATTLNPIGYNFDGTEIQINVRLADQLNNNATIADGTTVYFAAEGGSIQNTCITANGGCSVTWTSQDPRPAAGPVVTDQDSGLDVQAYSAARATILAWTSGAESFIDNNSNGLFDDGDTFDSASPLDNNFDTGEPFMDKNENGVRDTNEEFVNFPIPQLGSGGEYNEADALYAGPDCAHSTLCDLGRQSKFIFRNIEIVMASSEVFVVPVIPQPAPPADPQYFIANTGAGGSPPTYTTPDTFYYVVIDENGNTPTAGTTVGFDSAVAIPDVSIEIANTNTDIGLGNAWRPEVVRAFGLPDGGTGTSGSLDATINVPGAGEKIQTVAFIQD